MAQDDLAAEKPSVVLDGDSPLTFDLDDLGSGQPVSLRDGDPARFGVFGWDDPFVNTDGIRQADWHNIDIAMIGSSRLQYGLSPICNPISLTPENWRVVCGVVRPAFLLVESFIQSFDGHWYLDQFHTADQSDGTSIAEIVVAFRAAGIPTVFWDTLDVAFADHLGGMADQFDLHFFSDGRHLDGSRSRSTVKRGDSEYLPPACSPALQTPIDTSRGFADLGFAGNRRPGDTVPRILFDGWADIIRHRDALSFLETLTPDGLRIVDSRYRLYKNQIETSGPLGEHVLGCVTRPSLWSLTRRASARIVSTQTIVTPHAQHWDLVEAAACGTAIFQHGTPQPGGALDGFYDSYESGSDLVDAVQKRLADPVDLLNETQRGWRQAAGKESYAHRLQIIFDRLGLDSKVRVQPKVSVLAVTFRLQYLERILKQFDAQTYPNKELVLVVNSNEITLSDVTKQIGIRSDVRIAVLPAERVEAGSLNHGIRMATGDYIVKMDDDDLYGPNYVSDMILHASIQDLDLFGKANRFFYFSELNQTYARDEKQTLKLVRSDDLLEAHIGGATLSGRTSFFRRNPYPEGNFSATDTHYYSNLQGRVDGRFAILDDSSFVYWRRGAAEHSWKIDNEKMLENMTFVSDGVPQSMIE
ncbi:glycosyltransferase [Aestuariibius insulae]|uniref:glycosyltransferase n=1 Tax=Aestuariibius insulae TaxID=2058287 RepID=UPI00345E5389